MKKHNWIVLFVNLHSIIISDVYDDGPIPMFFLVLRKTMSNSLETQEYLLFALNRQSKPFQPRGLTYNRRSLQDKISNGLSEVWVQICFFFYQEEEKHLLQLCLKCLSPVVVKAIVHNKLAAIRRCLLARYQVSIKQGDTIYWTKTCKTRVNTLALA